MLTTEILKITHINGCHDVENMFDLNTFHLDCTSSTKVLIKVLSKTNYSKLQFNRQMRYDKRKHSKHIYIMADIMSIQINLK